MKISPLLLTLLLLLVPLSTTAQEASDTPSPTDQVAPLEGMWPTENLTKLILTRWVDEIAIEYKLDDDQSTRALDGALNRWPKFLKENRSQIQPVVNEFIEMRLEMEPPSKERVQDWATRAENALGLFRTEFEGATNDLREVLNPLQKAKFEQQMLEFGVGMMAAQAKLKQWKGGDFSEREFWDPPSSERDRRRAKRRAEQGEPPPEPVDQVTAELEAWDRYVEGFIKVYELDEAQQDSARSCLKELKQRAISYRDGNRDRIAKLESRIERLSEDGNEEELAEIKKDLTDIYGPIDDMFQELKTRLEATLTAQQREAIKQP